MLQLKFALIFITIKFIQCNIIVNTTSGQLKGVRVWSGFFSSYYAFKGIPYGEAPVDELRFRAPKPHSGWSGVRDASKHGNVCSTNGFMGVTAGGNEDCLFLNVYTTDVNANHAVMVFLHGGAYLLGDGNTLLYGPDQLMKEDIVVVTMNSRLGTLGFLSTGDKHAQGNYGLKDNILGLQWIQENIKYFGGDSSRVTLAGQSAGSVTIHNLLLSNITEGLFHQAIMMSGTAFFPFSFQHNPRRIAEKLGTKLGLNFTSTEELIEKLRAVDHKDILRFERDIVDQDNPLGLRSFDFSIVAESDDFIDERLIIDTPENLMSSGRFRTVPMLIGSTSMEGLFNVAQTYIDESFFDLYNTHPDYFVPISYMLSQNDTDDINEVASAVKNFYFEGKNLSDVSKIEYALFHTDVSFKFAIDRAVKYFARKSKHPIYYYEFGYDGAFNMIKKLMFLSSYSGAAHADDLFYLFTPEFPMLAWPNDHAHVVKKRIVRMWSNFVKTGNPTPQADSIIDLLWPRYTSNDELYMHIGHDLSIKNHFESLKLLHDFQKRFTNHF